MIDAAGSPAPAQAASDEDRRADNARGLLIGLIVLGHFLIVLDGWSDTVARPVLAAIYAFHIPAFVFLTGMTAGGRWSWRRLAEIALLLMVFQTAYLAPYAVAGEAPPHAVTRPHGLLWLLMSMIGWLALAPVMRRASRPLLLACALALAAGLIPMIGRDLSLSRTLVFLPFFVAGNLYGQRIMDWLQSMGSLRWLGLALIPAAGALLASQAVRPGWLYGAAGFETLGAGAADGVAMRAALLAIAAACTAALLAVIPRGDGLLARIGAASLSIYLLHGFAVKLFSRLMDRLYAPQGWDALWVALTAAAGVLMVLGLPFWDRIIRRMTDSATAMLPPEPQPPAR